MNNIAFIDKTEGSLTFDHVGICIYSYVVVYVLIFYFIFAQFKPAYLKKIAIAKPREWVIC